MKLFLQGFPALEGSNETLNTGRIVTDIRWNAAPSLNGRGFFHNVSEADWISMCPPFAAKSGTRLPS